MYCDFNVDLIPDKSEISVLAEGVCPVDWAKKCIETAMYNNCGKSVMCRDGMTQLAAILEDFVNGRAESEDLELMRDIATVISTTPGCEISQKAANALLYSIEHYSDEWDLHRRKRCSALVCPSYYSLYIDPAACTGCGKCLAASPEGAVAGGEGLIHVIKDDSALKNAEFIAVCPEGAIKKYGAIKPQVPEEPVAVGSFEAGGGRRRRRRG